MSSCSSKDKNESSSNESIILEFSKLKPYDLEPVCKPSMFSLESELEREAEEQGRIGNTDWCQCGECKPMATYAENLYCQDTNEVTIVDVQMVEINLNIYLMLFEFKKLIFTLRSLVTQEMFLHL